MVFGQVLCDFLNQVYFLVLKASQRSVIWEHFSVISQILFLELEPLIDY